MREPREHVELGLRILCYLLAAIVVYELAGMVIRWNPFRGVIVPALPALAADTNTPAAGGQGTSLVAIGTSKGTNGPPHSSSTNSMQSVATAKTGSNSLPASVANKTINGTNLVGHVESPAMETNVVRMPATNTMTNAVITMTSPGTAYGTSVPLMKVESKLAGTNFATVLVSTNNVTNVLLASTESGTNAAGSKPKKKKAGPGSMPFMAGMPGINFNPFGPPGMPGKGPELPPAVQARISRITDSEILGPVMHPLPMALLGIAGDVAFLRSDSGQTGLVKPGDTLDDIKLLRIGINRVLIEQKGQKKELTIFSGYGGESLIQNDSTNENKHL